MNTVSRVRRIGVATMVALGVVLTGVTQIDAFGATGSVSVADAVKAGAFSPNSTQTNADFINAAGPAAQPSQTDYGVPASVTVAQAVLESNWGNAAPNNNYFGIKCAGGDHGPIANGCANLPTTECDSSGCHTVTGSFRTYASMTDSFRDHGLFLKTNSRYNNAFHYTSNPDQFVREVAAAGYATDPSYASKVISIMQANNLYRFNSITASYASLAVYRPSNNNFYVRKADGTLLDQEAFGQQGDVPLAGHFQDSAYDNLAVYRPSNASFYIRAADGSLLTQVFFGQTGDVPVVGHFEDSNYDNLAVYRPSNNTFYIRKSDGTVLTQVVFGQSGDIPVVGHFEDSSYDNLAVYRPSNSTFYIRKSDGTVLTQVAFGQSGDVPVVGHFENSSYDNLAVYRPSDSNYYIRKSDGSLLTKVAFGETGDLPVVGHFQ